MLGIEVLPRAISPALGEVLGPTQSEAEGLSGVFAGVVPNSLHTAGSAIGESAIRDPAAIQETDPSRPDESFVQGPQLCAQPTSWVVQCDLRIH
jgi:hypothetical protein